MRATTERLYERKRERENGKEKGGGEWLIGKAMGPQHNTSSTETPQKKKRESRQKKGKKA